MKLLNKINTPADLRQLKVEDLPLLCDELRQFIVEELSVNPGHLASSLGAVEITVALHYVYNTPEDRIVWDVGHQAYGHKILTGRREKFHTNRKLGGIRPFPSPLESEYDTFTCGHASNSISAALGMAVASEIDSHIPILDYRLSKTDNRLSKTDNRKPKTANRLSTIDYRLPKTENRKPKTENRHVVALIGDGAMSGGLAFEGLNNVSAMPNNMLIILNDNNMSIDKSVGGMKDYLKHLNTNKTYNKIKFRLSEWMKGRGHLSHNRRNTILRFGNALKAAISGQQNIFEGLNIRYFGPFNGHNVVELVRILQQLKDMTGPKLLHIHTQKGHGYAPAEENPCVWHAPGKFDAETGERQADKAKVVKDLKDSKDLKDPKPLTKYQDVFGKTLLELAEQNPRIVGITAAMPTGCSMSIMQKAMPDRVFDVGIAEGHAVTFSAGLAKDGLLPFCAIYSSFIQRAYDNIIHDVAILNLPVVLCLDRAGLVGEDGATHHGAFDLAALRPIPNLIIAAPMNEVELRNMMYTAVENSNNRNFENSNKPEAAHPFVIRYPRGAGSVADWQQPFETIPIGKARKIKDGKRTVVLSLGNIGNNVTKAIAEYEQENPGAEIAHYDMRFLKPLDTSIIYKAAEEFDHIITVEDGCKIGGFGSAVLEVLATQSALSSPSSPRAPKITIMGLPDNFIEHGTVPELQKICGIDVESIKKAISQTF